MPTNWQEPTKAHGVRWQGFLMSDVRGDSSNRRKAKCSYCNDHFSNGKPTALYNHVKNVCKSIPQDKKSAYLQAAHAALLDPDHPSSSLVPQKRPSSTQTSISHLRSFSKEKTEVLHEILLKSMLSSDTPLSLLDNEHFHEYQRQLARSPYKIPSISHMSEVVIPVMHAKYEIEVVNRLQGQSNLTLSLDPWTDDSGNTVYALVVQRGNNQIKQLINVLNFFEELHTPQNIFESLKQTLQEKSLDWIQISSFVSDCPAVMAHLRSLIKLEFPRVLTLSCSLHAFNLLAKDILAHPLVQSILEANKTLITFFTTDDYWTDNLYTWANTKELTHELRSAFENRWYSMAKIFLVVEDYEQGFKNALALDLDAEVITPAIPAAVQQIILDPHHFLANQTLAQLIRPIVESISRLQRPSTTVGDIWPELASLHRAFTHTELKYGFFSTFKHHCQAILHTRTRVFASNEIYLVGFFLTPAYRHIAVSLKYTLEDLIRAVLTIAKAWDFSRAEAISIKAQVCSYYHDEPAFKAHAGLPSPFTYWSSLLTTPENHALKRLAVTLFELVPNATGVDSLYPIKTAVTSYKLPKMSAPARKMMSQLKYNIQYAHPNLDQVPYPSTSSPTHDPFGSPTELARFEDGAFGSGYDDVGTLAMVGQEPSGIDTLFDMNLFSHIQLATTNQQDILVPQAPSEHWTIEDLFGSSGQ
ncbi:hypothetical protein CROQUDRAFT_718271 [Cronartium quercuum f. sp. fusiforme G11]|uniref:BED-type domain-containing protein n=1 Tax=Cronartium quercuum f. sp. fusiforme G11 TaxID=708437 RepID=A0A9P6T892_9BASI|nr:hypothetical protein CROQUDRAFT_718271 [Cronartium quercuum f. sp. fusiforme G11]